MITAKEIDEAYRALANAQRFMAVAGSVAVEAKTDYDRKLKAGLADGTIAGKNADLREAAAAEVLAVEVMDLDAARENERQARLALDLAQTEVSRVQALLRLRETTRRRRR